MGSIRRRAVARATDLDGLWPKWLNWKNAATAAAVVSFGACIVVSAGACFVVGAAAGVVAARASAGCFDCKKFRRQVIVNTVFAGAGAGIGKAAGAAYKKVGRGPSVRSFNSGGKQVVRMGGRGRAAYNWLLGNGRRNYMVMTGYHFSYYKGQITAGAVGYGANSHVGMRVG